MPLLKLKVAYYILKWFLKSVEYYLIMIKNMMHKKHRNQISKKCAILDFKKS